MFIRSLTDKTRIQSFLTTDIPYHAYALADLDDPFFAHCQWWAAESAGQICSLLLIFRGLTPPVLLAMGQSEPLAELLGAAPLPKQAMILAKESQLPGLLQHYRPDYLDNMLRMTLSPTRFTEPPRLHSAYLTPLNATHLPALQSMYQTAHGNAFAPYQLEQGVFYGLFLNNELVSVAGTHVVSKKYQVAAVGNVFTRPEHRGRGYATQTTAAVCQQLLRQKLTVVLNVEQTNLPAITIYKKTGFTIHSLFTEGIGRLQPVSPLTSNQAALIPYLHRQ